MPKLYELDQQLSDLYESLVTDEDGAIDAELATQLASLSEQRENALIWLGKVAKSIASDADAYTAHLDYLRKRERMLSQRYERIKQYIQDSMERMGETKISADGVTLRVQRNSQASVIVPLWGALPDEFLRYRDPEPNKEKILAAVKAGHEVVGAEVVVGKHLRIV